MSGPQVHLTPPADHSKSILAVVIGISIALVVFSITRNTLPHVGDNIHSLPHGGAYKDGTKSIIYSSPNRSLPGSSGRSIALVLTITLPFLLYVIHRVQFSRSSTVTCGHFHCAQRDSSEVRI
nr:triple gene block 2 protein [Plantago yellow mosaic virus]